jgi:hypothetical protein
MTTTKDIRGECQHCAGQFDFPADQAGLTGTCPHCGQPTELFLATPPEVESPARTRPIVFIVVALVIVVGGLIGAQLAIKRAKQMAGKETTLATVGAPPPKPAGPFAAQSFEVSPVTLESASGSKLVYARGAITNTANQQRFGVKVELDLFDASGQRLGTASDYTGVIEPAAEWKFRAMVVDAKATSAKIAAIKETK